MELDRIPPTPLDESIRSVRVGRKLKQVECPRWNVEDTPYK